ncbi:MAG TPA: glutamate-1-semialdehyde 2,1-aminomutase [Gemmatales bacterium]|nr:glutamate-1-semialdehyde 2,1-aminomutase [Gemmatales bacterium]
MPADRPRSRAAHDRACRSIPGGVNSPARAFGAVGGVPITMARGTGPFLFDADGRRYLDYIGSWGPLILGHAHPRVVAAVTEALHQGSSFGAPTEREAELAELVVAAVPSIEQVRFTSSGTEAAMTAVRLARGCTGRPRLIKFAGCYHGHVDSLLVAAGSSATTLGVPNSPGVPPGATQDTLVLEFNDAQAVADACRQHGPEVAAILLEPVVGNMGLVPPAPGFLAALRELADRHGCLLIFDEVMTGFRLALGGAQQLYGIRPDLTVLGKIVGGGLPVGAVGGRRDLMQQLAPTGPVFQAGTLSGNPLAMAAGIATLRELMEHPPYEPLEKRAGQLAEGLAAAAAGRACRVQRVGSMLTLFFTPDPVTNYAAAKRCDTVRFARFFWGLADRGVYWPCSQFEAAFVSAAHTAEQVADTLAAANAALADLT